MKSLNKFKGCIGRRINHAYDIVIGAMADDQINFCTKKALKCLEYRGFEEVL